MHTSLILAIVAFASLHQTISADDRVNFTLYYETLCPDCRQFTSTQVWKAYQSVLDITNFAIVPYGNARETYDSSTQQYVFTCQHGAQECLGNIIHSCMLNYYPDVNQFMPFFYCTESTEGDVQTVATQCAEKSKMDFSTIMNCTRYPLGNKLQHDNAVKTENLQPQHQYVPWVTVNGEHTEHIEQEAERDLVKLICKTYKGSSPPSACSKYA